MTTTATAAPIHTMTLVEIRDEILTYGVKPKTLGVVEQLQALRSGYTIEQIGQSLYLTWTDHKDIKRTEFVGDRGYGEALMAYRIREGYAK